MAFHDHSAHRRDRQQADAYGQASVPYGQQFYQPPPLGIQQQPATVGQFQGGEEQGYTMFEDASGMESQPPPPPPPGPNPFGGVAGNLFANPAMTSAAMDYGAEMAKDMMEQNVSSAFSGETGKQCGCMLTCWCYGASPHTAMDHVIACHLWSFPSLQLGKVNSFLSLTNLKYYFAVDTAYVLKKLGIVMFPFSHRVSRSSQMCAP